MVWGTFMRGVLEALKQAVAAGPSINLTTLFAGGGVVLAALVVIYGALIGTEVPEDAVTVSGPVFKPVATTATATAPTPTPAAKPSTSSQYAAPRYQDDRSIARAVQAELKSAECYSGPINGVWNASTRAAMGEFTARVNARLPVDRPDPVLLALLETHNKISCTDNCSMGGEEDCLTREAAPPARGPETASIEREHSSDRAGDRYDEPRSTASYETSATAEDLGYDAERRRAPNPLATMQAASNDDDDSLGMEDAAAMTAAGAAAGAATHEATKPKRTSKRKYRKKNSLARDVSRGFRQIQRSLNKLF